MMDYDDILNGSRIILCPLEKEHLQYRVMFINDPDVSRTFNMNFPVSLARTEAWFSKNLLSQSRIDLTIIENTTGRVAGFCGLTDIDLSVRSAQLYMLIGDKNFWGMGLGRDANKLLANYAFKVLGLNRIYSYQMVFNERSIKSKESLNWKCEGLLREDVNFRGELYDRYIYSLLKREWENDEQYKGV